MTRCYYKDKLLSAMKSVKITVGGKTFQVRADADEKYLLDLAKKIDERFQEIKRGGSLMHQDQEFKAMTLVAIGLLDELSATKESYRSLRARARQFTCQMIAKIDDLLARGVS